MQATTFDRTQKFYDAIYSFKDYAKEARELRAIIERNTKTEGRTLLDVACGTGAHLAELRGRASKPGFDGAASRGEAS